MTDEARPTDDTAEPLSLESFRAELETFSGPLDLLLHLVRKEEIDIFDVPVSRITDRYLAAVKTMEFFDINVAAEFLVVAATLMEVKSRTLLPPAEVPDDEDEDDPGAELVRRLLEYKEFKEAAGDLGERAREHSSRFPRAPVLPEQDQEEEAESLLEDLAVWDLMSAFSEVLRQTQFTRPREIVHDDIPVSVYMDEVTHMLRASGGTLDFLDFFADERSKARVIGILLALLELFRRKAIRVSERHEAFGHLEIALREDAQEEGD
jgi:segregation and condensation protein A